LGSPLFAQEPLDVLNPAARTVWIHFEESSDPSVVGQTFGPPFPATYWVEGNTGRLSVASTWHRQLRMDGLEPGYQGTASAFAFEIDLNTFEATSQPATAGLTIMRGAGIFYTTRINQAELGTNTPAGIISGSHPIMFCSDQAYVEQLCNEDSEYCGETCSPIFGLPYDPDTGLVNLVGSEHQQTCDRCCCGPNTYYLAPFGDLLLTEVAEAPGLPNRPLAIIPVAAIMAFVAGTVLFRLHRTAKYLACLSVMALLTESAMSSAQEPLDLSNPAARTVWVHFEVSSDPTVVGQSFSPPFPATYWVEGNTGKLIVDSTWHRQLRGYSPNSGANLSSLQYEFNLTTLEATSLEAYSSFCCSGVWHSPTSFTTTQHPLGTTVSAGVILPDYENYFCPDQAFIDDKCSEDGEFCGQTCTFVPGSPYDPNTGLVNLVGPETTTIVQPQAYASHDFYSRFGDLMITEIAEAPGLRNRPAAVIPVVLIMALVAGVVLFRLLTAPR